METASRGEAGGRAGARAAFAAAALGLYALATLALLWPLLSAPGRVVAAGDGSGDSFLFMWNLWWTGQALAGDPGGMAGQSLLHTRLLFWPEGTSLAYHTLAPALGLLSLPLQACWPGPQGLARALNLLTALSFVLTGGGVLLLARQAGAGRAAALGAGLLALVQPYRPWHLNHLNLLSLQFGLLALWLLVRVVRRGRAGDAVGLALAAAASAATDLEATVHVALAAALLVAWDLGSAWRRGALPSRRDALRALLLAAALALLATLPLLLALRAAGRVDPPPPGAAEALSTNLLGLVRPGEASLLWGSLGVRLGHAAGRGILGPEVFLGPLFLVALLALAGWRRPPAAPTPPAQGPALGGAAPWLAGGGALLLLSLGPTLHAGAVDAGRGLLPWAWLGRLAPPLALSRAPVRLVHLGGLLLAVALAVLATRAAGPEGGLAPPAPRAGGRRRAALLAGLLVLLVLERWPARPVPVEPVAVPEAYRRLAAAPGALAVLQWPEESYAHWMHYLFWQTVHRKPMVLGYVSRRPPGADRFLARLGAAPPEARRALLEAAGVGWLVIHPPEPWGFEREPALIPLAAPPP